MRLFDELSNGLRGTIGGIAEGWQHLWLRARNAITYFAPIPKNENSTHQSTQWGIMFVDVLETDKALVVHLESPGMKREDFDIKIDHQLLIIRGTKNVKANYDDGRFHVTECAYGRFERLIPLPCEVDESQTIAKYNNGVLSINLPKTQAAKIRKISVN
ncbi:MAG: Hsp20/alpha crystallin family protein [Pseudomonadales bacterium]|nr:Hsp20/alpha crystallin family protein [Pseudomonadales bacterium]